MLGPDTQPLQLEACCTEQTLGLPILLAKWRAKPNTCVRTATMFAWPEGIVQRSICAIFGHARIKALSGPVSSSRIC